MAFPFENLTVYKYSLDLIERTEFIANNLKGKIAFPVLDQLTRAVLSIPLNISEGQARWHKGEKRQFYWIARGSVFEVVPINQILHRKKLIDEAIYQEIYGRLELLAKMLTSLIKSVDSLREKNDSPVSLEKPTF